MVTNQARLTANGAGGTLVCMMGIVWSRFRVPAVVAACAATALTLLGCETGETPSRTVDDAWVKPQSLSGSPGGSTPTSKPTPPPSRQAVKGAIAMVNGRPIARTQVVELLLEAHGVGLLEQLIVLDRAEQLAADRGITVTQADVDVEHERALEKLMGKHAADTPPELRLRAGETLLDELLSQRNISRAEFTLVTRRNAILRKIVHQELTFTEEQLRQEHARTYGYRVEIRHVQVASAAEADRILRQINAGVTIAELARLYSVNRASGEAGGLLPPFTADDAEVPELLRRTAFALKPGERSGPIHVDEWFHVIEVEQLLPAKDVLFETARAELERGLRERSSDAAMQEWYVRLFNEAAIEVTEAKLRDVFFKKHPDHRSAPKEVTAK
ncbi:MAG: peptidylprolyl isomerase [Phycisphaerales bacterium]|nr:peptidylprolyl isomerase [Phycisphaerales bacterium]